MNGCFTKVRKRANLPRAFFFLLLFGAGQNVFGQNLYDIGLLAKFPTAKEVVGAYAQNEKLEERRKDHVLRLAKKPDGYWVFRYAMSPRNRLKDSVQVWSAYENTYVGRFVAPEGEPEETRWAAGITYFFSRCSEWEFEENIFAGYPDAAADVVAALEGRSGLTPAQWYALGKAYGHLAVFLFRLDGKDEELTYVLRSLNPRDLAAKDLDKMLAWEKKAIAAFAQCKKKDANFRGKTGNVHLKWSNEHMQAYLLLRMAGRKEEADNFLEGKELYDEFMLNFGRNMLMCCDETAILFTQGDNDTYPLLYLQERFGYRKGIAIVNVTLVGIPLYLDFVQNHLGARAQVATLLSPKNGAAPRLDWLLNGPKRVPFDLKGLLDQLEQGNLSWLAPDPAAPATGELILPDRQFFITLDTQRLRKFFPGLPFTGNQMAGAFPGSYVGRNVLFVADVVQQNIASRPVCFSLGIDLSWLPFSEKHLRQDGLAYRLLPFEEVAYHKIGVTLVNNFTLTNKIPLLKRYGQESTIFSLYYVAYLNAANFYWHAGQPENALEILKTFKARFPEEIFETYRIWENYYKNKSYFERG